MNHRSISTRLFMILFALLALLMAMGSYWLSQAMATKLKIGP